jgi:uncharacterized membrane protein YkoI
MIKWRRVTQWLMLGVILSAAQAAHADEDFELARELVEAGKILPLETILDQYRSQAPGKILDIEFEFEHGQPVYEIEWLAPDGRVREWYIDAVDGKRLEKRKDR